MDGEAVDELERLAFLQRERAIVDRRGVDHPLVGPHVEAGGGRSGHLRERHALAGRGVGEVEVLRLRASDGGWRLAASEAAHAERVCGGLREAQCRACVSAAPLAGCHAAVRRRAVKRHVLLRGEKVADVDRVAAVRVGRVDFHRALLHERRILRGTRAILDVQPHHAVEAVAGDRLLRHVRAPLRLRSGALRVGRLPVVDAVDELPREPVSEMPDMVLRAHVGERLAGRQVERMEEWAALRRVDLEVPQQLAVAEQADASGGLFQLGAAERGDRLVGAAALRLAGDELVDQAADGPARVVVPFAPFGQQEAAVAALRVGNPLVLAIVADHAERSVLRVEVAADVVDGGEHGHLVP